MVVVGYVEYVLFGGYMGWYVLLWLIVDGWFGVLIFFVLSGFLIINVLCVEFVCMGGIVLMLFYVCCVLCIWLVCYVYFVVVVIVVFVGGFDVDCW